MGSYMIEYESQERELSRQGRAALLEIVYVTVCDREREYYYLLGSLDTFHAHLLCTCLIEIGVLQQGGG